MILSDYSTIGMRRMIRKEDIPLLDLSKYTVAEWAEIWSTRFAATHGNDTALMGVPFLKKTSSGTGKVMFVAKSLYESVSLRCLAKSIADNFTFIKRTREREFMSLLELCRTTCRPIFFRCDIQSFFESIKFRSVIEIMTKEQSVDRRTERHLHSLADALEKSHGHKGLPRGLPISSLMADIYMQKFDRTILRTEGTIHYSRYVDDIIWHSSKERDFHGEIKNSLASIGLNLNPNKTKLVDLSKGEALEYLGYEISKGSGGATVAKLSERKIKKIRTRVALSIIDFGKTGKFDLLIARMKYLSGVSLIRKANRARPVLSGISRNYQHCTSEVELQLKELDAFKNGLLRCKRGKTYGQAFGRLSKNSIQMTEALSISFVKGYELLFSRPVLWHEISEITKAWKYAEA